MPVTLKDNLVFMLPTIVIPAFSRKESLSRLLDSISDSNFPGEVARIIISLDGGYSASVLTVAETFAEKNPKLNINIIKRETNIGLKEHILWCGDLTDKYDSIIVLEDDLIVGADFYQYAVAALDFYKNDDNIAGISLYGQKYNEYANLPFEAMPNGTDTYFMQIASSWGQAWTRKQWNGFKQWYVTVSSEHLRNMSALPNQVSNWPDTSWKKFYSAYVVEKNKYFVYPFLSRTSNCADSGGQHIKSQINYLQVPVALNYYCHTSFRFCPFKENLIKYDAYMEAVVPSDFSFMGIDISLIAIDLYGTKPSNLINRHKYIITTKKCKNVITKIPIRYKPIESNILFYKRGTRVESNRNYISFSEVSSVYLHASTHERLLYCHLVNFFSYCKLRTRKFTFSYFLSLILFK